MGRVDLQPADWRYRLLIKKRCCAQGKSQFRPIQQHIKMIEHIAPQDGLVKSGLNDFQARKGQFADGQVEGICQDRSRLSADIFKLKPAKGDQLQALHQRGGDCGDIRPCIQQSRCREPTSLLNDVPHGHLDDWRRGIKTVVVFNHLAIHTDGTRTRRGPLGLTQSI